MVRSSISPRNTLLMLTLLSDDVFIIIIIIIIIIINFIYIGSISLTVLGALQYHKNVLPIKNLTTMYKS